MDLRQLRTFISVAQSGSISKSARLLHIAQPALSRQIKLLETELKTTLFVRNARGMALTAEGLILLNRAKKIFEDLDEAVLAVSKGSDIDQKVSLGMPPSWVDMLANKLNRQFSDEFPNAKFRLVGAMSGFVADWLLDKSIDIGLYYETPIDQEILEIPILDEPLYSASFVDPDKRGIGEPIDLNDLASLDLVLPSRDHSVRRKIEEICSNRGIALNVSAETDSLGVQKRLMWEAGYSAIMPFFSFYDELIKGSAYARPLLNPEVNISLNIGFLAELRATKMTSFLIQAIVAEFQKLRQESSWEPNIYPHVVEKFGALNKQQNREL